MAKNGIKHLASAPYHPTSNGLAERAVQTVKGALRKEASETSLERQLTQFLFRYRLTPHSTTGRPSGGQKTSLSTRPAASRHLTQSERQAAKAESWS